MSIFKNSTLKCLVTLKWVIISVVLMSFSTSDKCDPDALLKKNAEALDDFVFIKAFPIEVSKSGDKAEYSYVLSRGISYRIVVCDEQEEGKRMIVNLLDRNRKLIATN